MGAAQTGPGKTAGFGLPMLQRLLPAGQYQHVAGAPSRARTGAHAYA